MRFTLLITLFLITSLSYSQYVNITDPTYGANGNDSFDNSDAIQKAITDNPGRAIFFPKGNYKVNKPIYINHNITIIGEDENSTFFKPQNCIGFIITSPNVTIKNLTIYGTGHTGIYASGKKEIVDDTLNLTQIHRLTFESIIVQNCTVGIELKHVTNSVLNNIKTLMNPDQDTSLISQGIRFFGKCVNNKISNSHIESKVFSIAIIRDPEVTRAEGLMITNTLIASGSYGVYSEGILSLNITNCIIDLSVDIAIDIFETDAFMLTNNWIASILKPQGENHPVIKIKSSHAVNISNNTIAMGNNNKLDNPTGINGTFGISLEAGTHHCTIIGNSFLGVKTKVLNISSGAENIDTFNTLQPDFL